MLTDAPQPAAVSRIALVKPDRARAIEQLLARMAQSGQLRGRVSEDQLIDVLDQVRAPAFEFWIAVVREAKDTHETRSRAGFDRSRLWRRVRAAQPGPSRRARSQ